MTKNMRFIMCGSLIFIGLGLYILGAIILPSTIGLQIQHDGEMANHINKYIGLLIPLGMTIWGAAVFITKETGKALITSILGLLFYAITFWANLR